MTLTPEWQPLRPHGKIRKRRIAGPPKGQGYRHEGSGIRYRTTLATSDGACPSAPGSTEPGRVVDSAPVLASALPIWDGPPTGRVRWSPRTTCCPTWARVGLCAACGQSGAPEDMGVAIGRPTMIAPELWEGTLVPVIESASEIRSSCCLITTSSAKAESRGPGLPGTGPADGRDRAPGHGR